MIERRNLVHATVVAGAAALLGTSAATEAAAAQSRDGNDNNEALVRAVDALTSMLTQRLRVSPELERVREQQRVFLKANQKYPDFIEVGIDVWEAVHDWHVRHQQPLTTTRTGDGRYLMTVMFTTLILRPEQTNSYVGFGFDAR
jgi:hypothetical protein